MRVSPSLTAEGRPDGAREERSRIVAAMDEAELRSRVRQLEAVATGLTIIELRGFMSAYRPDAAHSVWPPADRYWYSGTAGVKFTKSEEEALQALWTRMLVALTRTVTNIDLEAVDRRPGLMARLQRLAQPRASHRLEGHAATAMERALGGEVWAGVIGIWNAFCAVLLREKLHSRLYGDLQSTWRGVMHADLELPADGG